MEVLVVGAQASIRAAKQATKTIPIVMVSSVDPVAAGIVGSDWPKDRLWCPKDSIYFSATKHYTTRVNRMFTNYSRTKNRSTMYKQRSQLLLDGYDHLAT